MPKHEFGIMNTAPVHGKRYDEYEPQKYNCIIVDDSYIEAILKPLSDIDFYWHTLDVSKKGLAYYGITLIPPTSSKNFIAVIENISELSELKSLLQIAVKEHKYIIHFGI